jgi:hypothetical protein
MDFSKIAQIIEKDDEQFAAQLSAANLPEDWGTRELVDSLKDPNCPLIAPDLVCHLYYRPCKPLDLDLQFCQ